MSVKAGQTQQTSFEEKCVLLLKMPLLIIWNIEILSVAFCFLEKIRAVLAYAQLRFS